MLQTSFCTFVLLKQVKSIRQDRAPHARLVAPKKKWGNRKYKKEGEKASRASPSRPYSSMLLLVKMSGTECWSMGP